jgi:4-diphosphocytidyl-2-C-methyl-D-erythritol kinase
VIQLLSPAKLNLGLEVLGRRDDGYHELRTVVVAVSLMDRVTIVPAEHTAVHIDTPAVDPERNLVTAAVSAFHAVQPLPPIRVAVRKRIPLAAGLGGASSNAAATLHGLEALANGRLEERTRAALTLGLGSDVPFFLGTGPALVAGRGERVQPLPLRQPLHAVVVAPWVALPSKTATMYGRLTSDDFSSGAEAEAIAAALGAGRLPVEGGFRNAFERALYALVPEMSELRETVLRTGAPNLSLSGAGPSHYVVCDSVEEREWLAGRLRRALRPSSAALFSVRSVSGILVREGPRVARDHQ